MYNIYKARGFCPLFYIKGENMGKHHDKVLAALEIRKKNAPDKPGFNKPGSMNKRKTGYVKRRK